MQRLEQGCSSAGAAVRKPILEKTKDDPLRSYLNLLPLPKKKKQEVQQLTYAGKVYLWLSSLFCCIVVWDRAELKVEEP
jgi:hypothetical protein